MKLFSSLYTSVMRWARHRHAQWYLAVISFAESSFFPIPPDVMLAPMALAKPSKAMYFATLTTIASVLGGVFGYLIGMYGFDFIRPLIENPAVLENYELAKQWFADWGFWAIFIAGFSPIPYKVFTIAAGAMAMSLFPFVIASIIGRGARFFLVAGLLAWGGERAEKVLHQYVDRIGWLVVIVAVLVYVFVKVAA